jgi:hypothetical protein
MGREGRGGSAPVLCQGCRERKELTDGTKTKKETARTRLRIQAR